MDNFCEKCLSSTEFMPHGMCYMWNPSVIGMHVVSDALISIAYYSIPFTLLYFVRRRKDLAFSWMFVCFAVFILACGTGHLLEIANIWYPRYWLSGGVKVITAGASIVTAILLVRLIPQAVALPSPSALKMAHDGLQKEVVERRKMEQKFRGLLESAPDAIVIINHEGRNVLVNVQAEKLFHYDREKLLNQTIEALIPERLHDQYPIKKTDFSQFNLKAMKTGLEIYGLRRDGTEFPIEINLNAIETEDGIWIINAIRDISVRKHLEKLADEQLKELARSNEELEQFGYVASHDLQEPLRAVASCVQLFEKRYKSQLDERADELIFHTVDGTKRMQTLINDLLAFSKVGTKTQAFESTDCGVLLKEVLTNLSVALSESSGTVTHDFLPTVKADSSQLRQVFQNLIGNAIKFHGEASPVIHISAKRQANEWLFSVADNGIGIESQYFERIFQVFQRLHTCKEYQGTGIGLAICKKIVERHGGQLWVESQFGKGSTFYFTIPERK